MYRTLIIHETYNKAFQILSREFASIQDDGCAFVIVKTEYDSSGNAVYDFMDIIEYGISIGYSYVNTIVYPTEERTYGAIIDNVKYIIWLCKSKNLLYFNKDAIREKHIWKDVEWGKRGKNYNPKGKDPGNVWIPTEDDNKGHITKHILLTDDDIISRLIKMTDAYESNLVVYEKKECNTIKPAEKPAENYSKTETKGIVIFGTSESMPEIENESVSVAVTSPPYWDLKDYFKKGQIGQEPYEEYLSRMSNVWKECYSKLKKAGSLWININIRNRDGKTILIPKDIIRECKSNGFFYKGILIWHKSSGIPTHSKNIVDRHEYVLVFSKSEQFHADVNIMSQFCDYKNSAINGAAFWNINRKAGSVGKKYIHPAIYPTELVERIVLCSSNYNDLVLDPFLGSGTSLIASLAHSRNFVGLEYYEGFEELMMSRYKNEIPRYIDSISFIKRSDNI
ncbi:MAG: DNA methyltransferase [Bacillota bacterium]